MSLAGFDLKPCAQAFTVANNPDPPNALGIGVLFAVIPAHSARQDAPDADGGPVVPRNAHSGLRARQAWASIAYKLPAASRLSGDVERE